MSNRERVKVEARELFPSSGTGPRLLYRVLASAQRTAYVRGRTVTAEQVEAAAEAIFADKVDYGLTGDLRFWKDVHDDVRDHYESQARAAFEAAGLLIEEEE